MPFKPALLRAAARMPPTLRSRPLCRVLAAIARRTPDCAEVSTNLGISARLRCDLPVDQTNAVFGKPTLYAGERGALELAWRLAQQCGTFVDVGAHLGYFTFFVRAKASRQVRIHYFEPDPALFARLERNVRANELDAVVGHPEAVGETNGVATFFTNRSDTSSGSLTDFFATKHDVASISVTVRTFASFATTEGFERACVKVDVEGAEGQFLAGATGVLGRVGYLIMEVLGPAVSDGFVARVMSAGRFNGYYINDFTLERSLDGSFTYREPEYNWLFCRETPQELERLLGDSPFRVQA